MIVIVREVCRTVCSGGNDGQVHRSGAGWMVYSYTAVLQCLQNTGQASELGAAELHTVHIILCIHLFHSIH